MFQDLLSFYDMYILPGGSPSSRSVTCEVQGESNGLVSTIASRTEFNGKRLSSEVMEQAEKTKKRQISPHLEPLQGLVDSNIPGKWDGLHLLLSTATSVTGTNLACLKESLPGFPGRWPRNYCE